MGWKPSPISTGSQPPRVVAQLQRHNCSVARNRVLTRCEKNPAPSCRAGRLPPWPAGLRYLPRRANAARDFLAVLTRDPSFAGTSASFREAWRVLAEKRPNRRQVMTLPVKPPSPPVALQNCQTCRDSPLAGRAFSLQLVLLSPRQLLRLAFGFLAAQFVGDGPAAGIVVEVKIHTLAAVRKADLIASAIENGGRGGVSEQADFHCNALRSRCAAPQFQRRRALGFLAAQLPGGPTRRWRFAGRPVHSALRRFAERNFDGRRSHGRPGSGASAGGLSRLQAGLLRPCSGLAIFFATPNCYHSASPERNGGCNEAE